ncbi:MAG: Gfo/Idh/MocA family oxidoreductase, partial [Rhodothermales bacterium]|nr:Gfo/Idh/MocA family oxidoreductase [Rhodothermales bacterium]
MKNNRNRRIFIKNMGVVSVAVASTPQVIWSTGKVLGANDRINFAVAGLNGRGKALMQSIGKVANTQITHLCDVDSRAMEGAQALLLDAGAKSAILEGDYRNLMDKSEIDAVAIASPDHWHAPMAIMAAIAGKSVFVEKPCCHNPAEGELLVEAKKKYNAIIQMGNQQRSGNASKEAIEDIQSGIIGDVYMGKAWYANTRGPIGKGKASPVPEWLDWELWQGPAPRVPFKDNIVHYNWHWFWNWGTGEINNNGTHEIDICRWALGVTYPSRVTSSGGRYHF